MVEATASDGIQLEFSDARPAPKDLPSINAVLAEIGAGFWPLDLADEPAAIRALLAKPRLSDAEAERVKEHFLLSRERLVETIERAGRRPGTLGGGQLQTFVSPHDYWYPQLYVVQDEVDYGRFDRFHVNVPDEGAGVDEVLQLLSGGGLVVHLRSPRGETLTLRVDCPRPDAGWLGTYDGAIPHIGSLSGAQPGTKALVQVIGPARWSMRYLDDG